MAFSQCPPAQQPKLHESNGMLSEKVGHIHEQGTACCECSLEGTDWLAIPKQREG